MTGGEKLLIAGVVGLGLYAVYKFSKASAPSAPPVGPPTLDPQFDMSGLRAAGPLGAPLAVLQPAVSGGINALNRTVGGTNPYAGLTRNADGTYTDGAGCKITFKPDGSYTRSCPKLGNVGQAVYGAGKAVVSTVESWFS